MVVIDTHLARGASNGGATFHAKGGPYGMTKGAKRIVAVDVTGLPLCVRVVPTSTHESRTVELLLEDLVVSGQAERLELVLVDKGTSGKLPGNSVPRTGWRCVGSADLRSPRCSVPSHTRGGSRWPTGDSDGLAGCRSRLRTRPPRRLGGCR